MSSDELINLLQYIQNRMAYGDYSSGTMEPVIKFVKKQIKVAYLDEEDE